MLCHAHFLPSRRFSKSVRDFQTITADKTLSMSSFAVSFLVFLNFRSLSVQAQLMHLPLGLFLSNLFCNSISLVRTCKFNQNLLDLPFVHVLFKIRRYTVKMKLTQKVPNCEEWPKSLCSSLESYVTLSIELN